MAAYGYDTVGSGEVGKEVGGVAVGGVDDIGAGDGSSCCVEYPSTVVVRTNRGGRYFRDGSTGVETDGMVLCYRTGVVE